MRRDSCGNGFLVRVSMYLARNSIIVSLFEALSQVTCLICACFLLSMMWIYFLKRLLALCAIPSQSTILNKAPPRHFPLCALLSLVKPSKALCNSHMPGCGSLIQCPVTAKYPLVFEACHASQVRLMSPWTTLLFWLDVNDMLWIKLQYLHWEAPWVRSTGFWT